MGRTVATLVVLIVVLSGCGGLTDGGPERPETTVTPVPLSDASQSVSDEAAAGVSTDGVEPAALAKNHRQALRSESFTQLLTVRWITENGTAYRDVRVFRTPADRRVYALERSMAESVIPGNRTKYDLWHDGNRTYARTEFADGAVDYRTMSLRTHSSAGNTRMLYDRLDGFEPRSVSVDRSGGTVVHGALTEPSTALPAWNASVERNGTMSVRIHPSGYVDRLALEYDVTVDGELIHVRALMDVTQVGETNVSRPDWVDEAGTSARPIGSSGIDGGPKSGRA